MTPVFLVTTSTTNRISADADGGAAFAGALVTISIVFGMVVKPTIG